MGISLKKFADEMSFIIPSLHREFLKGDKGIKKASVMSISQIVILHFLSEKLQCKMSELAKLLDVTTSAITGMVDRMARSGILKRSRDRSDRRVVYVKITRKGIILITSLMRGRRKRMLGIFKNLTSKERETYLNLVKKIHNVLTGSKI